jgi:peptidoglycan-associated lipoprotein
MHKVRDLALCFGLALTGAALVACGSDKKTEAKAPDNTGKTASTAPTATATTAHDPSKTADSPTASNVRIDKEILRLCGIPEPEAFFGFDSAIIRPQDAAPLDKVAVCFISGPLKGRSLRVVGHADPRGGHEYNMILGQKRADSVAGYLVSKGMEKSKAESTTRGAMDSTATDEAGWAKDRRVDVLLGQ